MVLSLPKSVEVLNPKLQCLYITLLMVMVVCLIVNFFTERPYQAPRVVKTRTRVRVDWEMQEPMWQASTEGGVSLPLCQQDRLINVAGCITSREAVVPDTSDRVTLVTDLREAVADISGRVTSPAGPWSPVDFTAEALLDFSFTVEEEGAEGWKSNFDYETVLIDSSNRGRGRIARGERIRLSTRQVVEMTQGERDDTHKGFEIASTVECRDNQDLQDVRCYLRFHWVASRYEYDRIYVRNNSITQRTYAGLLVRCETGGGTVYVTELGGVFKFISTTFVFLSMPKFFLLIFCTHCLGLMSSIYTRVLREPFSIVQETANMATRLMTHSVIFAELSDLDGKEGISKDTLGRRLHKVLDFRGEELDEMEIEAFVTFVHQQIIKKLKRDKHRALEIIPGGLFKKDPAKTAVTGDHPITMDSYVSACSFCDRISFDNMVHLLDKNRRETKLEKIFMPRELRLAIHHARATAETIVDSGDSKPAPAAPREPKDASSPTSPLSTLQIPPGDAGVSPQISPQGTWTMQKLSLEDRKRRQWEAVDKVNAALQMVATERLDLESLQNRMDSVEAAKTALEERLAEMEHHMLEFNQKLEAELEHGPITEARIKDLEQAVDILKAAPGDEAWLPQNVAWRIQVENEQLKNAALVARSHTKTTQARGQHADKKSARRPAEASNDPLRAISPDRPERTQEDTGDLSSQGSPKWPSRI